MPLHLTGRHMAITEAQKDYIDKKVDRLRRLCPKIDELSFTLTKEKLAFVADGTLRAGSLSAVTTVTASQPLEAIDLLVDKMEQTVSRQKAKRKDHHLTSREKSNSKAANLADEPLDEDEQEESGEAPTEPQRATA